MMTKEAKSKINRKKISTEKNRTEIYRKIHMIHTCSVALI